MAVYNAITSSHGFPFLIKGLIHGHVRLRSIKFAVCTPEHGQTLVNPV